ncbi:transglycosylase family protein [Nocardia callitridis]|uniref:Resuscitation-promoting factor core lysozyme-like domain-containing protein n=1 Tax=Nocardia callitridis TaxID=648753 RepID=A0ABP9KP94_9NOCA
MSLNRKFTTRAVGFTAAMGALVAIPFGMSTATASANDWDAVAQCESSGNWNIDSGNGFSGGLQFTPSTWAANGGTGDPSNASREEQIRVAENVLATQGPGAWPVCGAYL